MTVSSVEVASWCNVRELWLPLRIDRRPAVSCVNTPGGSDLTLPGTDPFADLASGVSGLVRKFSFILDRKAASVPSASVTSCCQSDFPVEITTLKTDEGKQVAHGRTYLPPVWFDGSK